MEYIRKTEPNEKVRRRVAACKEAGMIVTQDFIHGKTEVKSPDGEIVLVCNRKDKETWELDYNSDFWDESIRGDSE